MKKTCDGCKALEMLQGEPMKCLLGYKMDNTKGIPLEQCEKPKTIKKFIELNNK